MYVCVKGECMCVRVKIYVCKKENVYAREENVYV